MDPTAGSSSTSNNEKMAPTFVYLETSMNPPHTVSTKSDELVDLKDVACVVFNPVLEGRNLSVYLVDLANQRLRGFARLDSIPDLPRGMATVVYESKLYMFGGRSGEIIGPRGAYVLDLAQLARADIDNNQMAVRLERIPDMSAGKVSASVVLLGDKICVFDYAIGHNLPGHNFEIFDPQLGTWYTVPDPFFCEPGQFVDGVVVLDSILYISVGQNTGVYELHLDANTPPTPTWIHHHEFHGARFLPVGSFQTQFDTLLFTRDHRAYNSSDPRGGFASERKLTVTFNNERGHEMGETLFNVGDDIVCRIRPTFLCRAEYLFVVSKCRVVQTSSSVNLDEFEAFTVPMGYLYEDSPRLKGFINPVVLCDH